MAVERAKISGTSRRRAGEPREFDFDVLMDGQPVRRSVPVTCSEGEVWIAGEPVALDSVFWVSRRAGLVLLFARTETLAFLGRSGDLAELARTVERGSDRAAQRSLLQPLAAEVVVCTAGTAASGTVSGKPVQGLHLAVFTQHGLHLFAQDRRHSVAWPVERVSEVHAAPGEPGRAGLKLVGPEVSLTLRYLFPEEIHAVARVARCEPTPLASTDSLEMFAQGEVAPPPPADLPEFSISAQTLQTACLEAAGRVRVDASLGSRIDRAYFEHLFQDLGEIALGPLILRRSAALGAGSLAHAVQALDAEQLRQDAIAAFHGAADQLFMVYGGEVDTLLLEKRLDRDLVNGARAREVRDELLNGMSARMEALDPTFGKVLARQHLLLQRLHARDHAPPETAETGVAEATHAWKAEIERLDRAYGKAWGELLGEIADLWSDQLIPRLKELAAKPRQRLSESARLAILAAVTLVVVGALALWLL